MSKDLCPCGSKKAFSDCCGRFLDGGEKPRTPEQLMRSRYTAYTLGDRGDYLVSTWLTAVELGYTAADFNKETEQKIQWQKLEIIKSSQKGNLGQVEFKAYYTQTDKKDAGAASTGTFLLHHEKSLFKRMDGVWYYVEAM